MASKTNHPKIKVISFPDPLLVSPELGHLQSFIILHGRGSWAAKFAARLLETVSSGNTTLQAAFPHAKLIFPSASINRATIYGRKRTSQWFDNWHLDEHTKRQDLMSEGLQASVSYIHGLIKKEIQDVGTQNVVLWGLSQGCATSLSSLLTWDGEPIAAVVGMCGWMPFANVMEEISKGGENEEDDEDPFARLDDEANNDDPFTTTIESKGKSPKLDLPSKAIKFFRDEIGKENTTGMAFQKIPVFFGHGTDDENVNVELGRAAKRCLESLGSDVKMVEYEGLGHWYSADMLDDVFVFIREKLPKDIE